MVLEQLHLQVEVIQAPPLQQGDQLRGRTQQVHQHHQRNQHQVILDQTKALALFRSSRKSAVVLPVKLRIDIMGFKILALRHCLCSVDFNSTFYVLLLDLQLLEILDS